MCQELAVWTCKLIENIIKLELGMLSNYIHSKLIENIIKLELEMLSNYIHSNYPIIFLKEHRKAS